MSRMIPLAPIAVVSLNADLEKARRLGWNEAS